MGIPAVAYRRNSDFIFRKIIDETILVPIHQDVNDMDSIYAMNEVASFIWEFLEKPGTYQDMEIALLKEYDAPQELISSDLERFLDELISIGAIRAA